MNVITKKQTIISWIILLSLTGLSVFLGTLDLNKMLLIPLVLLTVLIKGQQIIDVFMELAHAPKKWRRLLLSYVVIIPTVIVAIYLF